MKGNRHTKEHGEEHEANPKEGEILIAPENVVAVRQLSSWRGLNSYSDIGALHNEVSWVACKY